MPINVRHAPNIIGAAKGSALHSKPTALHKQLPESFGIVASIKLKRQQNTPRKTKHKSCWLCLLVDDYKGSNAFAIIDIFMFSIIIRFGSLADKPSLAKNRFLSAVTPIARRVNASIISSAACDAQYRAQHCR